MGLWDYDDDDDVQYVNKSQEVEWKAPSQEMHEDDEGNIVVKKKRGKQNNAKRKETKQNPAVSKDGKKAAPSTILLISDDEDGPGGADDDIFTVKPSSKGSRKAKAAHDVFDEDSPLPALPQPSSSLTADAGASAVVSDAARRALEAGKILRQKLELQMKQSNEEQVTLVEPGHQRDRSGMSLIGSPLGSSIAGPSRLMRQAVGIKRSREEDEELERMMAAGVGKELEEEETIEDGSAFAETGLISITCQHGSYKVSLKIGQGDKLHKLQEAFLKAAREKSLIEGGELPQGFKLMFDDEKIDLENTPKSLGIEDGDIVDAVWKGGK